MDPEEAVIYGIISWTPPGPAEPVTLLTDNGKLSEMGAQAKARALDDYTWESVAAKTASLMNNMAVEL